MASITDQALPAKPLGADRFETMLAVGAVLMLAAMTTALLKGYAQWGRLPPMVWVHLATISVALVLTPVMLLRPRGDQPHRYLGRIWVAAMLSTALSSFFVAQSTNGGWSVIHILSVWVSIQVPIIYWSARTHRKSLHRRLIRGMVLGALLIAGFFTFPFNRQLGAWLFS
ncbi:MAG: DUF2306 domain-containing protein [Sphingomonadaceae bacterium]